MFGLMQVLMVNPSLIWCTEEFSILNRVFLFSLYLISFGQYADLI
jgi:hypothetical protein